MEESSRLTSNRRANATIIGELFTILRRSQFHREPFISASADLGLQLANSMAEGFFKPQVTCCRDDWLQPRQANCPARLFASEIGDDDILAQGHNSRSNVKGFLLGRVGQDVRMVAMTEMGSKPGIRTLRYRSATSSNHPRGHCPQAANRRTRFEVRMVITQDE